MKKVAIKRDRKLHWNHLQIPPRIPLQIPHVIHSRLARHIQPLPVQFQESLISSKIIILKTNNY